MKKYRLEDQKMNQLNYAQLFKDLDDALQKFIQEVNTQHLQNMATEEWSVKDVLCHVVFWHQYYAQNYAALSRNEEPFIFTSKGGSQRNQIGVDSLKATPKDTLLNMLQVAQRELYESIVVKKVPAMNYTDRKRYTTEEFLEAIIQHIRGHTVQIMKAR